MSISYKVNFPYKTIYHFLLKYRFILLHLFVSLLNCLFAIGVLPQNLLLTYPFLSQHAPRIYVSNYQLFYLFNITPSIFPSSFILITFYFPTFHRHSAIPSSNCRNIPCINVGFSGSCSKELID